MEVFVFCSPFQTKWKRTFRKIHIYRGPKAADKLVSSSSTSSSRYRPWCVGSLLGSIQRLPGVLSGAGLLVSVIIELNCVMQHDVVHVYITRTLQRQHCSPLEEEKTNHAISAVLNPCVWPPTKLKPWHRDTRLRQGVSLLPVQRWPL